jgi:hypothetical protein
MDFAPAPARGEGGRRADRSGGGWGADGMTASSVARCRTPPNAPEIIVRVDVDVVRTVGGGFVRPSEIERTSEVAGSSARIDQRARREWSGASKDR